MFVYVIEIKLYIRYATSLKDKRKVLMSLKEKLKNKFNVSICESYYLDNIKQAKLSLSIISTSNKVLSSEISKIEDFVYNFNNLEVVDFKFNQIM